jgi:hypothetical protein
MGHNFRIKTAGTMIGMGDKMPRCNGFEPMMMEALTASGWERDLTRVYDGVITYKSVFRRGYVHPSQSGVGRGTTFIDAGRVNAEGRHNFISLKGSTIEGDNTLPNEVDLTAGVKSTMLAALDAARDGVSIPVIHYAARVVDGEPEETGYVYAFDAAPLLAASPFNADSMPRSEAYRKGERPAVSLKLGRAIPSGGKRVKHTPGTWGGDGWSFYPAEDKVRYPVLTFGYAAMGVRRANWTPIHIRDLADFVESAFDWNSVGFRF